MTNTNRAVLVLLALVISGVSFYAGSVSSSRVDRGTDIALIGVRSISETAIYVLERRNSVSDSLLAVWKACAREVECTGDLSALDALVKEPQDSLEARVKRLR